MARSVRLFLEAETWEVDHVANGRAAQAAIQKAALQMTSFDLVVLDLMLPDIDGLSICRFVRRASSVPVVMLTARTTEEHIVEGLEAGADDYVCKPFGARELVARIRRCLERASSSSATEAETFFRVGALELDAERRRVRSAGEEVRLTRTEFDILRLLMQQPGRVFTRSQLIDRALGPDFDGTDRAVDTHIWSLRRKLGEPRGRPRYILSELGVGYRMRERHAP